MDTLRCEFVAENWDLKSRTNTEGSEELFIENIRSCDPPKLLNFIKLTEIFQTA